MSPAQREAMALLADATAPVKINAATARILRDRYGYVEAAGDGWTLTPRGRMHLHGERVERHRRKVEDAIPRDAREWAERVEHWLKAHGQLPRGNYASWSYARHVAACDRAGLTPVEPLADAVTLRYIEDVVRAAALCVTDFDEASTLAVERGVGVSVSYEADDVVPRSRREAAREAVGSTGVVNLRRYRERRA